MNPKNFFAELKRRNVYKVAVAYAVVAWLLIQLSSTLLPTFHTPEWVLQTLVVLVALGLPVVLVFAWAFEITPEGIKRTEEVSPNESVTRSTGRKLDFVIIAVLAVAVALLVFDRMRHRVSGQAPSAALEKSIAVLPFENLSANQENAFFTYGVQDEILTDLAKIADLKVISRTSVMLYQTGVARNLPEIACRAGI